MRPGTSVSSSLKNENYNIWLSQEFPGEKEEENNPTGNVNWMSGMWSATKEREIQPGSRRKKPEVTPCLVPPKR